MRDYEDMYSFIANNIKFVLRAMHTQSDVRSNFEQTIGGRIVCDTPRARICPLHLMPHSAAQTIDTNGEKKMFFPPKEKKKDKQFAVHSA